jgi:hypothetical protein
MYVSRKLRLIVESEISFSLPIHNYMILLETFCIRAIKPSLLIAPQSSDVDLVASSTSNINATFQIFLKDSDLTIDDSSQALSVLEQIILVGKPPCQMFFKVQVDVGSATVVTYEGLRFYSLSRMENLTAGLDVLLLHRDWVGTGCSVCDKINRSASTIHYYYCFARSL